MVFFALFLIFLNFSHGRSKAVDFPISDAVLITTNNAQSALKISKSLSKNIPVLDLYDTYLVVKITPADAVSLNSLSRHPQIVKVTRGIRLKYLRGWMCPAPGLPIAPESDFMAELTCIGQKSCLPSGQTRLWAQQNIATDLAQKYLSQKKVPRVTKIAAIDSGFDKSRLQEIQGKNFQVKPALNTSKKFDTDPVGHGSRVVSLIKGVNGLGGSVNSPLTVYGFGESEHSTAEIGNTVLRACNDGNQIINVSMGEDGFGIVQNSLSERLPKDLVSKLRKKGCIIVHAAGNDGGKIRSEPSAFEPQIAAMNTEGALTSSAGDFLAPGEGVTGLNAGSQEKYDPSDGCNGQKASLASGTSFAAPLFTSHLSLVRDMLLTSKDFRGLTPDKQADLLAEITKSSNLGNTTNAYLAVLVAEEWKKNPKASAAQAKIRLQENNKNECQKAPLTCEVGKNTCDRLESCETIARERAILCRENSPEQEIKLIQGLEERGDLEGAAYWKRVYKSQFPDGNIDSKFPVEKMRSELTESSSQAQVARWVQYYANSKNEGLVSEQVENILRPIATQSLLKSTEISGRASSRAAHANFTKLFISMKQAGLSSPETISSWVENLQKKENLDSFYVDALVNGERQGVVSNKEMSAVISQLTSSGANPADLRVATTLLEYSKSVPSAERFQYARKISKNTGVTDEILKQVVSVALGSDDDLSRWIPFAKELLNKPQAGPKTASEIITAIWSAQEYFPAGSKESVQDLIKTASSKLPEDDYARTMISMITQLK